MCAVLRRYISRGTDRVLRGLRANDAGAANELDTAVVTALEVCSSLLVSKRVLCWLVRAPLKYFGLWAVL